MNATSQPAHPTHPTSINHHHRTPTISARDVMRSAQQVALIAGTGIGALTLITTTATSGVAAFIVLAEMTAAAFLAAAVL